MQSTTAPKGKTREEIQWRTPWWEFVPLVERARRPVEWSPSSIIFTAHATRPQVVAQMLSSAQFLVPSPAPIVNALESYEPPTVISIHPGDDWLFAYFPGRGIDGVGCLWKRGLQVDSWSVKEWWNLPIGGGIVTACWSGAEREWAVTPSGSVARLPSRGPALRTPLPILFSVTEDHQFKLWYFRSYVPTMKILSCSLSFFELVIQGQNIPLRDTKAGPGGTKRCVSAAIGLGYQESSVLIAMRSQIYPSAPVRKPQSFDLNVPLDASSSTMEGDPVLDQELWGEESTIEMAEVQIKYDGNVNGLITSPLPSIAQPRQNLTQLLFICTPPSSNEEPRPEAREPAKIYLAASFANPGDFSSEPKSEMVLYSLTRNAKSAGKPNWDSQQVSSRLFFPGVLTCMMRCLPSITGSNGISAVILQIVEATSKKKRDRYVGQIIRLKLPDLSNDLEWDASPIFSRVDTKDGDLPLTAAVSPSHALVCLTTSWVSATQSSLHPSPKRTVASQKWNNSGHKTLSQAVVLSLRSRHNAADIVHLLSSPTVTMNEVVNTLHEALSSLEAEPNGFSPVWTLEVLGVATEIYRKRALATRDTVEKEELTARWKTAHGICSLAACNIAFEECNEGEGYDLAAAWQLVSLSGWVLRLLEKLMKECVLFDGVTHSLPPDEGNDLFGPCPSSPDSVETVPSTAPMLVWLVQPFALTRLRHSLKHMRQFRAFLGNLNPSSESAHIAKDILVNLIDCSGIDLKELESVVLNIQEECKGISFLPEVEICLQCLAACNPLPSGEGFVKKIVRMLLDSRAISKAHLFIKPSDLVDGMSPLPPGDRHLKKTARDVITKGLLQRNEHARTCLRCGEESETGRDVRHSSLRWTAWEKRWMMRCVCGGNWINRSL